MNEAISKIPESNQYERISIETLKNNILETKSLTQDEKIEEHKTLTNKKVSKALSDTNNTSIKVIFEKNKEKFSSEEDERKEIKENLKSIISFFEEIKKAEDVNFNLIVENGTVMHEYIALHHPDDHHNECFSGIVSYLQKFLQEILTKIKDKNSSEYKEIETILYRFYISHGHLNIVHDKYTIQELISIFENNKKYEYQGIKGLQEKGYSKGDKLIFAKKINEINSVYNKGKFLKELRNNTNYTEEDRKKGINSYKAYIKKDAYIIYSEIREIEKQILNNEKETEKQVKRIERIKKKGYESKNFIKINEEEITTSNVKEIIKEKRLEIAITIDLIYLQKELKKLQEEIKTQDETLKEKIETRKKITQSIKENKNEEDFIKKEQEHLSLKILTIAKNNFLNEGDSDNKLLKKEEKINFSKKIISKILEKNNQDNPNILFLIGIINIAMKIDNEIWREIVFSEQFQINLEKIETGNDSSRGRFQDQLKNVLLAQD